MVCTVVIASAVSTPVGMGRVFALKNSRLISLSGFLVMPAAVQLTLASFIAGGLLLPTEWLEPAFVAAVTALTAPGLIATHLLVQNHQMRRTILRARFPL